MVTVLASSVNKFSLFLMASLATAIMHTVSVMIGAFLAYLIPKTLIQIIVITLFTGFGIAMLYKSSNMDKQKEEQDAERKEIEEELEKMDVLKTKSQALLDSEAIGIIPLINSI
jgi:putative Ca2+/H+ antiporter (TMEM165/GDT1 family)